MFFNCLLIFVKMVYNIIRWEESKLDKKEKSVLPKGFFTQSRPHVKTKEDPKDKIPFKWSKEILNGKSEVTITSLNKTS